jgi:TolB protein
MNRQRATLRQWALLGATLIASLMLVPAAHATFPGPNGKIAFVSDRDGNREIYTVNRDGTGLKRLTNNPADDFAPAWSPDGHYLVFSRSNQTPAPDVYIMNADGTGQTYLWGGFDPTWSADGGWVTVADGDRRIVSVDAFDPRRGFRNEYEGPGSEFAPTRPQDPAWLPAGTWLTFARDHYNSFNETLDIFSVIPPGINDVELTSTTSTSEAGPDYSPDGHRLAFHDLNGGVFTMNSDGTSAAAVPGAGSDLNPVWSPDGTKLAVQSKDSSGQTDLVVMNPDGSARTPVVPMPASNESQPAWQPGYPPVQNAYARPKGATPIWVSLVPAHGPAIDTSGTQACGPWNRMHGGSLAHPSCSPPHESSPYLTVGTPDANGNPVKSIGSLFFHVKTGDPATAADEADVRVNGSITDVRCKIATSPCDGGALSDYTGELLATFSARITDRYNGYTRTEAATTTDSYFTIPVILACRLTPDTTVGSSCEVDTTFDAILPGSVPEGKKSIWEFGQVEVWDGGTTGSSLDADIAVFARQGLFVP